MSSTKILSKTDKAKELGISYKTLERWIQKGKISFITVRGSKRKWFLPSFRYE